MRLNRSQLLGLSLLVLLAATACVRSAQAVGWKDCPGSVGLGQAPAELAECLSRAGADATDTIQFEIGDAFEEVQANSSLSMGLDATRVFFTDTPVDILWRDNERVFQFDDVGGTGEAVLLLNFVDGARLDSAEFAWQNRPLNLPEVLERARRFQAWLEESGYAPPPAGHVFHQPFTVLNDYQEPTAQDFSDWLTAEAALSNEERNIREVRLYAARSATTIVLVTAKNMRRTALNFQDRGRIEPIPGIRRTVFDGNGGYEWLLTVRISRVDPAVN